MKDVSTRSIIDILHFLDLKGQPYSTLINSDRLPGLPTSILTQEYLLNPRNYLTWEQYLMILESLSPLLSEDRIREYMKWSIATKARWTAAFRPVAKLFTSPKNIYLVVPWAASLQFTNLKSKMRFLSGHRAVFELSLRPEDRGFDLFYQFTAKAMEALPLLAGFKQSHVAYTTNATGATFNITYFPAIPLSLLKRLTLPIRSLLSSRSLLKELQEREDEVRQQYSELASTATKFEKEASVRSAQYAAASNRLDLLMQNSPDLIVTVGRDKRISYMNRFIENYRADEVIGRPCLDFIPADSQAAYSDLLDAAFRGEPGAMELPITDHSWYLTRVVPISENGAIDQVLVISSDITQVKLSEQRLKEAKELALSASRTKSAFVANVSHEIRTPLASIIGFAELLVGETNHTPEVQSEYCQRILTSGRHLLNLVTDILDISKIEAGSVTLNRDVFKPSVVIKEVANLFLVQANLKGLTLTCSVGDLGDALLVGDTLRLRQILFNLVGNALKFTNSGEISIRANLKPCTENAKRLRLTVDVIDTGCGIDMKNTGFVFAPFEQLDNSATRKHGGSGLGLFLSRQIAMQMGGDVILTDSAPGKGSTFTLKALFDAPEGQPAEEKNSAEQSDLRQYVSQELQKGTVATAAAISSVTANASNFLENSGNFKSILIVEDNIDLAYLLRIHLETAGYRALAAHNGKAAIDAVSTFRPDLILMDLHLPVMDGYEALKILRKQGLMIPIYALTANARDEDRRRCLELGFTGYWSKPMPRELLLSSIAAALKDSTAPVS